VKAKTALIAIVSAQLIGNGLSQAEAPKVTGSWEVEIAFQNGEKRSFKVEAQESGKASFLLLDPKLKAWGPAKPSEAKWTLGKGDSVTFSGRTEFPLGNVGRDVGTLVLEGKFRADGTMTGEARFFRGDDSSAEPKSDPAKSGSFKATRLTG
jgi:hypothetical protein